MRIRPPAVAGTFYPAEPQALSEEVAACLVGVPPAAGGALPKAVIAPHAGYVYSGPIAGHAYASVRPLRGVVTRVVLLGPAHHVAVRGLAASSAAFFSTPLGRVPVDRPAVEALCALPQVHLDDDAHAAEHSLEVQLPFLQQVLGEFALVPLVVGDAGDAEIADVLDAVWGGPETLIVVSSDLSHYHAYRDAQRLDAATCAAIEDLHPDALDYESACGRIPIRGLLVAARHHGLTAHTLDLRSSGDTAGGRDRVVGYGAWALA